MKGGAVLLPRRTPIPETHTLHAQTTAIIAWKRAIQPLICPRRVQHSFSGTPKFVSIVLLLLIYQPTKRVIRPARNPRQLDFCLVARSDPATRMVYPPSSYLLSFGALNSIFIWESFTQNCRKASPSASQLICMIGFRFVSSPPVTGICSS